MSSCRKCINHRARERYWGDEKIRLEQIARTRDWQKKNPERVCATVQRYKEKPGIKEQISAQQAARYKRDKLVKGAGACTAIGVMSVIK